MGGAYAFSFIGYYQDINRMNCHVTDKRLRIDWSKASECYGELMRADK
jgi:hypothetical protein